MEQKLIGVNQFGKDHWSLLVYVEYRAVNRKGVLDLKHMRIKNPALLNGMIPQTWKPEWGTRLYGYWNKNGSVNPKLTLPDHDDYDCLDDLENAGLVKSFGTGVNPAFLLTKKGAEICSLLALHKQEGKPYADFVLEELSPDSSNRLKPMVSSGHKL